MSALGRTRTEQTANRCNRCGREGRTLRNERDRSYLGIRKWHYNCSQESSNSTVDFPLGSNEPVKERPLRRSICYHCGHKIEIYSNSTHFPRCGNTLVFLRSA